MEICPVLDKAVCGAQAHGVDIVKGTGEKGEPVWQVTYRCAIGHIFRMNHIRQAQEVKV